MELFLFENYNKNLDLKNELINHLGQYPYISYSVKDDNDLIITFNKDITTKYGIGILDVFNKEIIEKYPLKVKIISKKNVDKFEEFNGKTIIENIEYVDLPEFGLKKIKAKIDSGASVTSMHISKLKIDKDGKQVSFIALDPSYKEYNGKVITKPIFSFIQVQSSDSKINKRVLIKTKIIIKEKELDTFLSLNDRSELEIPILIGKDILSGNFLINAGL